MPFKTSIILLSKMFMEENQKGNANTISKLSNTGFLLGLKSNGLVKVWFGRAEQKNKFLSILVKFAI